MPIKQHGRHCSYAAGLFFRGVSLHAAGHYSTLTLRGFRAGGEQERDDETKMPADDKQGLFSLLFRGLGRIRRELPVAPFVPALFKPSSMPAGPREAQEADASAPK
ncbi:hypothetical protein MTO96_049195 [Rhipicephalus appendiculatus]